jgi:hypothetical protein
MILTRFQQCWCPRVRGDCTIEGARAGGVCLGGRRRRRTQRARMPKNLWAGTIDSGSRRHDGLTSGFRSVGVRHASSNRTCAAKKCWRRKRLAHFNDRRRGRHRTMDFARYNVEVTGPPTYAAKPQLLVVGPCWPTCYTACTRSFRTPGQTTAQPPEH